MYQRLHVQFLVREDDTVLAYEERGKLNQSGMSQYEKGIQALSHLDRTQQVEVLQGILDMLILSSLFTGNFMFDCDIRPCYSKLFALWLPIFSFIIIVASPPLQRWSLWLGEGSTRNSYPLPLLSNFNLIKGCKMVLQFATFEVIFVQGCLLFLFCICFGGPKTLQKTLRDP